VIARSLRPVLTAIVMASLLMLPVRGAAQTQPPAAPAQPPAQQPPAQQPPAQQPPVPQPPAPQPPAQEQRPVVAITVRGNERIPTEQILAAVTRTKVGEPFSEEKIREDIRAINELGVFADVTARTEVEAAGLRVVFVVLENPVVTEVVVEGNTVVSAEEIRRALGVAPGEVLNIIRMREGTRAIQKLYEDRGYVLARVVDTALVPVEGTPDQARLRVRIAEGTVEALRFTGLRKTRQSAALRYIQETKKGAVFNVPALNRDLQRLFDTGLFESIRARPEPGADPDTAVVVIEVVEARTGSVGGGLGYSSSEGLLGFIEYRDRNWRGLGQTFAVRAERNVQTGLATAARTNYEINFTDPFLDALRTTLDLSLFARATIEQEFSGGSPDPVSRFELQRAGSTLSLGRPLDPVTHGLLRLKSERTEIIPLALSSGAIVPPSAILLTPGRVVSLLFSATRDTRNDRLRPTRGSSLGASAEFALRPMGSDFGFNKYVLDYQQLFPAGANAAFVGRVFIGSATGMLPAQEQFLLGGSSTVRSYASGRFRANSMIVLNAEYRFSLGTIIKALGELQGIVFADAGNAPLQFTDLKTGYGVGVAIGTPVGPIRIDLAFGPEGRQTWISLGSPF
jgi:outer membrane protein insertion porin family